MNILPVKELPAAVAGLSIRSWELRWPRPGTMRDGIASALAALRRAYGRRRDRRHLDSLPNHLLKDIGISRDEIDAAVSGLTRREVDRILIRC